MLAQSEQNLGHSEVCQIMLEKLDTTDHFPTNPPQQPKPSRGIRHEKRQSASIPIGDTSLSGTYVQRNFSNQKEFQLVISKFPGLEEAIKEGTQIKVMSELKLEEGAVSVMANYIPKIQKLFITTDRTKINGESLRFDLNDKHEVESVTRIDDEPNFLSGVFDYWGVQAIGDIFGRPTTENFERAARKVIEQAKTDREFRDFSNDPSNRGQYGYFLGQNADKGIFVPQDFYQVTNFDIPLMTQGLATCSCLVVVDPENRRQLLAHVDSSSNSEQLKQMIQNTFPGESKGLKVYLMEGNMPSGTGPSIYEAVTSLGIPNSQIKIMPGSGGFESLGVFNGIPFRPAEEFNSKATRKIGMRP